MAELQTDINVKIKLGDEKNSSGGSNLPPIDKGSIVITKDTNKIYIDTTDDVPERIEIGENKQDKFATVTNEDSTQTVSIDNGALSITSNPNFGAVQITSNKVLELSGTDSSTNSYVSLRKTKLGGSCDFDATQGYLRVRNNPLADDFAVNKKYVDDAIGNITALFASLVDMTKTTQSDEPTNNEGGLS